MLVYLAIKYHGDQRNRPKIEAITDALGRRGIEVTCVVRDVEQWGAVTLEPMELMRRAFDAIDEADVLLVDLTEKGVGLGIEAGYAHARSVPIVTIAEEGADISTTLRGVSHSILRYSGAANWILLGNTLRAAAESARGTQ